ncbi:hypothetical protein Y032_0371g123 [Ancylostoma ceylanicum]|uniref:Uncharacterized protein n=1 Tax=Ancylostoma ceylanicum TaxID=53326 RepID=A0A016RU53_9BILA|nr:hypothetical protein Y032_0371g123 [Ancylostoma ceylanicum]
MWREHPWRTTAESSSHSPRRCVPVVSACTFSSMNGPTLLYGSDSRSDINDRRHFVRQCGLCRITDFDLCEERFS